jgi:large subunit ribosomal protein L24
VLKNKPRPRWRSLDLSAGDPVVVIAGKDRGKQGEILRALPREDKVVVRGINIKKRHVKAGQRAGGDRAMQGGIVDFEAPVDRSNEMLVCPSCNRPTRLKQVVLESGDRAIQCLHCGEPYERVRKTEAQ